MGDSNKQPVEGNARGELSGIVAGDEVPVEKKKPLDGLGKALAGIGAAFDQPAMGRPNPAGPQLGAPVNQAQQIDPNATNEYIKQLQALAQQNQGGPYFG